MPGTPDAAERRPRDEALGVLLVSVQLLLLAALAVAGVLPATRASAWAPPAPWGLLLSATGWLLVVVGGAVAVVGLLGLGSALRASPVPAHAGDLRTGGAYGWVRHPVYTGLLTATLGWVLVVRSWPVALLAVALLALLAAKARWEESLLTRRYPGYADYAARTPRFVPRRPRPQDAA